MVLEGLVGRNVEAFPLTPVYLAGDPDVAHELAYELAGGGAEAEEGSRGA